MRFLPKVPGDAFTFIVLFLATGAFQSMLLDNSSPQAVAAGNPLLQIAWIAVYVLMFVRALQHRRILLEIIRANKLLFAVAFFALLSTLWSSDPGVTLRRGVAVVATTVFGADLAARFSLRDQLKILAFVLGVVVVLSVFVQVLFPGLVPTADSAYGSAWNGAFIQKNDFARIVVLATIVWVLLIPRGPQKSLTTTIVVGGACALVLATQSKTGLVVLVAMLGWMRLLRFFQKRSTAWMAAGVLGLLIVAGIVSVSFDMDHATQMLGRDSTLTGRTQIWELSLQSAWHRPILGYGYSAFWNVSPEALHIRRLLHWDVPHAHNGFIELILELGFVGLGLMICLYLMALVRGVRYLKRNWSQESAWPLLYVVLTLMYQITENTIFVANTIFWMLLVAAICSITEIAPARSRKRVGETAYASAAMPRITFGEEYL